MPNFDHLGDFNPHDYPIDKLGTRNFDYTSDHGQFANGSLFVELPAQPAAQISFDDSLLSTEEHTDPWPWWAEPPTDGTDNFAIRVATAI